MLHKLLSPIALTAMMLCVACSDSDSESTATARPGKPQSITVTYEDDGAQALLSTAALNRATEYVWYRDGDLFETTLQPECTVDRSGRYKVAGRNEAGLGEFSDEAEVAIQESGMNLLTEAFVPDAVFRNWIDENLAGGSGFYSMADAAAYDGEIYLEGMSEIKSLQGIEYFTSLKRLRCDDVTSLSSMEHILQLSSLEYLWIMFSNCAEFDLTPLRNLQEAHIMANSACKPDGLKVAGMDKLRKLTCNSNNLEKLDLSGCTALEELVCSYNALTNESLILPEKAPLSLLAVHTNTLLSEIDLSNFVSTLTFLNVGYTGFRKLDLSSLTHLEDLSIEGCGMTSDALTGLSNCVNLKSLRIDSNDFDTLDVSALVNLEMLRCDFNKLVRMDLSNNPLIQELSFQGNELAEITLTGLAKCWYMNLSQNALKRVDLTPCVSLEQFFCNGNKLKKLENRLVEIKMRKEYDVDRLNNPADFNAYCDEIGKYFYSYDGTGIFVHEFSDEE